MAYGYNQFNPYQTLYQPPQMPQQPQNSGSGIIWVQGEAGAKAYPVAPGCSVLLMDSESKTMFVKSADVSGMPAMRVFDYTERTAATAQPVADFITREEFNKKISELAAAMKGGPVNA